MPFEKRRKCDTSILFVIIFRYELYDLSVLRWVHCQSCENILQVLQKYGKYVIV